MRIITVSAVLLCACGVIFAQTPPASPVNPSRQVAYFGIHDKNMIDALLILGQQEHIGIGLENIDVASFRNKITMELRWRTVGEVLNVITHPLGYRWSSDGQVVTVTHDGALLGKRNLLNTRIPHFSVGETTMHDADLALRLHLYYALNPHAGGLAGDYPGGNREFKVEAFEMKNATVRQILNRIVSQHGSGAWVVQQPPWTMDKDLGRGIWRVVEYDRKDGDYSTGIEVWGLGLRTP